MKFRLAIYNIVPGVFNMIFIKKKQLQKIIDQAKYEFPNECCGFLSGYKVEEDIHIEKTYPLTNIDKSSEHFSMDPREQFAAVKAIRNEDSIVMGNYHSHPYTTSRPSEEDKRLAYDKAALYGILSLVKDEEVFNLFRIDKDKNVKKLQYKID